MSRYFGTVLCLIIHLTTYFEGKQTLQGPILGVRFRAEHVLVLSVRREFTVFKWSELIKQCDLFLFLFTLAQKMY